MTKFMDASGGVVEERTLKVSVYVGTSVDGFIAKEDGSVDWLNEAQAVVPEGEDCGFQAFLDSVDALVMGRKTFEQVVSFGTWPYGNTPVLVLSRGTVAIPRDLPGTVSSTSVEPRNLIESLGRAGCSHVYVDGGTTIHHFLEAGLVDEITVTVIPVHLGAGIPLFNPALGERSLQLLRTHAYDFGFVQSTYAVLNHDGPDQLNAGAMERLSRTVF